MAEIPQELARAVLDGLPYDKIRDHLTVDDMVHALAAVLPDVRRAPAVGRSEIRRVLRDHDCCVRRGQAEALTDAVMDVVHDAADVLAEHGSRPWQPGDGDTRCQDCGHKYEPWFTEDHVWNGVMGGGGCLCPRCFMERAGWTGVWRLAQHDPAEARDEQVHYASIRRQVAESFLPLAARLLHLSYDVGEIDDEDVAERLRSISAHFKTLIDGAREVGERDG